MISDKKSFLLDSIIRAYIEHSEPIGSKQLKSMYNLTYSSATIRGYFKKLGEEGYLIQEHSSSGRRPTIETLKNYWGKNLKFDLPKINSDKKRYIHGDLSHKSKTNKGDDAALACVHVYDTVPHKYIDEYGAERLELKPVFYVDWIIPFELISILLLVAIVAVLALAYKKPNGGKND